MKDIKIVIGANFGDEGKGLMTDYFSQKPISIVVCSNGGAQRGHTVVTPDGIRHVFHHFGSGTFNGASTYLSEDFIVNPIIFKQEWEDLYKLGYVPGVYVNKNCMITTPYDMMANQIIEESRGKNKHGSCGLGIFETIKRYKVGVTDIDYSIRKYYFGLFEREGIMLPDEWKQLFLDNNIFEHFLDDWDFMNEHVSVISDEYFLNDYDNIVFEAGQGLLLDQNNTDYYPHLTPSNTGIDNPMKIIENVKWDDEINVKVCYVSRTYMTRHGAGRFDTECKKSEINKDIVDLTNVPNPHQDSIRYGTLNLHELRERIDFDLCGRDINQSIAITHCNECEIDEDELVKIFNGFDIYMSDGMTNRDIKRL